MTAGIASADTAEAETAEAAPAEAEIASVAPTIVEAGNPLGAEQVDTAMPPMRPDLQLIADMIPPRCRVLDIGCDRGDLLAALWRAKAVDGRGLELSMAGVRACVRPCRPSISIIDCRHSLPPGRSTAAANASAWASP